MATTSDRLVVALDCVTDGRPSHIPRSLASDEFTTEAFRAEAAAVAQRAQPWTVGPGVQGVGIGEKVTKGRPTGELALRVYVDRKRPNDAIDNPVPEQLDVADLHGITTDVVAIGPVEPEMFADRARPCMPGCGVAHAEDRPGTLGAFVRRDGDTLFALSNAHVLAVDGLATVGDAVLQPAADDGGHHDVDTVAHLEDFVPLEFSETGFPNLVDAAIARVTADEVDPAIRLLGHGPMGITTNLRRGMRVHKVGRTTDLTTGIIQDVHFRVSMQYRRTSRERARVGFRDQVLCTRFTDGGDSGSLVLSSSDRAVGLHFAGSPSASVFNRIAHVLGSLRLELVTED